MDMIAKSFFYALLKALTFQLSCSVLLRHQKWWTVENMLIVLLLVRKVIFWENIRENSTSSLACDVLHLIHFKFVMKTSHTCSHWVINMSTFCEYSVAIKIMFSTSVTVRRIMKRSKSDAISNLSASKQMGKVTSGPPPPHILSSWKKNLWPCTMWAEVLHWPLCV